MVYHDSFFELPKILQIPVGGRNVVSVRWANLTNKEQESMHTRREHCGQLLSF